MIYRFDSIGRRDEEFEKIWKISIRIVGDCWSISNFFLKMSKNLESSWNV